MAGDKGYIDEFIGSKAIEGIDVATQKLEALLGIIVKTADSANKIKFNSGGGSKSTINQLNEEDKLLAKLIKTSEAYGSKTEQLKVQISHLAAENKVLAKEQVGMLSLYDKLTIAHKKAERDALDVGVQYGVTSQKFKDAAAGANVLYKQLTGLEQALGNHKRSVGQYSNAVFGLSQVLREMPAFTYSAQMGVMALGNNLPILADNFKQVMKSTDDATGKINGFGGALKIFARSIFSFVNIFTIAIGLFTIFYDEILEFIGWANKGAEAIEGINKAWSDTEAQKAKEDLIALNHVVTQVTKGYISQEVALRKYNDTWGKYIGFAKTWDEAQTNILEKGNLLVDVLIKQAVAQKFLNASVKASFELAELEKNGSSGLDKFLAGAKAFALKNLSLNGIVKYFGTSITDLYNKILGETLDAKKASLWEQAFDFKEEYKKIMDEINVLSKSNGINLDGDNSKPKKEKKKKEVNRVEELEVNRVEELKKQYEKEQKITELAYKKGELGYIQYQDKLLEIAVKYSKIREKRLVGETKSEDESGLDFDLTLANDTITALQEAKEAVIKVFKDGLYTGKDASKAIGEMAKLLKLPEGSTASLSFDKSDLKDKLSYKEMADAIMSIGDSLQSLSGISDALFEREMQRFDIRERRLQDQYDNELRFIEQTGLSAAQKEKKRQQLERETEAARKKIDRDRLAATIKQAKLNKAFATADVVFNTASAILVALTQKNPILQAIGVATAIATGATQLAKIAITPLPQYAKGRKGGDAEFAIVSENGQEARRSKDGTISLLPKTKSVVFLNKGDDVIPHHELIKSQAFITLAKKNDSVNSNDFQIALLMAYEKQTSEIKTLQKILIGKNFSIKNNGDDLMNMYKKQFIG